ncbi:Putative multidrug export ATP-binding/permease protein SAV1866 [uncultured Roseburia sp.]|uniref:ABC transporter ATP-binding protein/permease n=1 Tax=Brotonthovivens ammoniilytica TaxID=2981725 RepID=A0ABT2TFD8_9FIRM|nr:ABC transporter ATP-binding protein [Brotonthovivens ammoniilytica]MCU6760908.1 ABC transporter ATP-binding protein/permease [Brotonthovivens ammoniilytica]SCI13069.1 Putative multidrug export ATP-binding/permease protein SAV1866 [uncultured Roseburia sp.]
MIKTLAKSIREYKLASVLAAVFMVGEVLMEVLVTFMMAKMIDEGFSSNDLGYVIQIGAGMLIMAAAGLVCGLLSGRYAAVASGGLAKNLRKDIFYNIQEFSFQNIDKFSTASLVTRLTTDITNVQMAYMMIIRLLVRSPIMIVFSLVMAFMLSAKLSLIFVILVPVLAFLLFVIIKSAHGYFVKLFKKYDHLNSVVQENLTGIRTVKAYIRESHEIGKFEKTSKRILDLSKSAEKRLILTTPCMFAMVFICIMYFCYTGANMIVSETLTTGALMSLITYSIQILSSLMMASMVLVMCVMAKASGERIAEVLDEKSSLTNQAQPDFDIPDGSIVFDHVSFAYSDGENKEILKDINLNIKSGETVGIIGGTGSAKTTLVQLIPRLYDVTGGKLLIGGKDVRTYDLKTLRDSVSMVLQKNVLFSGTISSNLRWGNKEASQEEIEHAAQLAQADEFVSKFPKKYETVLDQGGTNVSGGQKQRLCIARALLKKPKILILDDSTSAVDTKTDALIRKAFAEEIPDTTKLIIAQRISSVEHADKILVMQDGCICDIGTHEELLRTSHVYQEVYESQQKGGIGDE